MSRSSECSPCARHDEETNDMGIFSRNKSAAKNTGEIGTFTSPHSISDTLVVVYEGIAPELSVPERKIQSPESVASIYLSRLDARGVTVTAGNKIETYFQFSVDLQPHAQGCKGRV